MCIGLVISVVRIRLRNQIKKISIISIICLLILLSYSPTGSASPNPDLIIESNLRYLFDTGGGDVTITVQGELAQELRQNIFDDDLFGLNASNDNATITKKVSVDFGEAFEDLLELNINLNRIDIDDKPEDAYVDYNGNYKIIKLDRVDIKSIDGLEGTNNQDSSKFTIKIDIKGKLLKDSEVTLSDAHIILYALWGEEAPLLSVNVKETATITTIGMDSYSDLKLDSGGEVKYYRLGLGESIEYKSEYKLDGYETSNNKKDTVAFDSFNIINNPLVLIIVIFLFSIIASITARHFVKRFNVEKVRTLQLLGAVFFIILIIIYFLGISSLVVWGTAALFFVINLTLAFGVYQKGWGNLSTVTVRHEDFYKEPPKIEQGPWHERGISNAKVGNFLEAVNCFENALESEPENAIIWNDLGFAFRKLGKFAQALECFNKALELRPGYSTAMENRNKTNSEMMSRRRKRRST